MGSSAERQTRKSPSLRDRLADAAPNQRRALLIEQIRRDTGRVLGLQNLESLPNNKSLGELGLDSLMAVELRNALASTAGAEPSGHFALRLSDGGDLDQTI